MLTVIAVLLLLNFFGLNINIQNKGGSASLNEFHSATIDGVTPVIVVNAMDRPIAVQNAFSNGQLFPIYTKPVP